LETREVLMRKTICTLMMAGVMMTGAAKAEDYVMQTASTGGTFHPVGVAISTLSKVKLLPSENFSLTAVNSAGSGANLQAMASGTADFSILQGLFGYYAARGTGPLSTPMEDIRSVSMLWQNVEHFILRNDLVDTGTAADIVAAKGAGAGMGARNSGSLGSGTLLMEGLGLNAEEDFQMIYSGYGPTLDAMANGQIEFASIPAGVPAGAITQILATNGDDVTILNVTPEEAEAMDGGRELWTAYTIPPNSYPGQDEAIQTIAQPNFLAVNDDVSEDHVYKLTKALYENLPFLQSIHPATKAMSLEVAIAGLPTPLHPGAVRYYREVGLDIPERLLPPEMQD
jgi:TRAP transporter TAXI family solute receptor